MHISKFHPKAGPSAKRPWSAREFIRLACYVAKTNSIRSGKITLFRLAKIEAVATLEMGFPRVPTISVYHYGPYDQTLNHYIQLEISEGYVSKTEDGLELTEKGEKYVKTVLLPQDGDGYCRQLAELLLMSQNGLVDRAYKAAGFSIEKTNGVLAYRLIMLEDFTTIEKVQEFSKQVVFNTLLSKITEIRQVVRHVSSLPRIEVKNFTQRVQIDQNIEKLLVKYQVPASKATQLIELKNAVLNRFAYILAIYFVNVIEKRYASFDEVYYMTHDWALEFRRKRSDRYLGPQNAEDLRRRNELTVSRKIVKHDLSMLVEAGMLRRDNATDSYVVSGLSFTNDYLTLYLLPASHLEERYQLLLDELSLIQRDYRARDRAYNGGVDLPSYEGDPELPNVRVVKYDEKSLQLTRLRSQGILSDRLELLQILHRMYHEVLMTIKQFLDKDVFHKNLRVQIILVLRDAVCAWQSAVDIFQNTPIGMIGHVRNVTQGQVASVEVPFVRCEDISNFDTVIIVDPMVASGSTLRQTVDHLKAECKNKTVPEFVVASILVSRDGARRLQDANIFCVSLEKTMEGAWLDPGLRGVKDLGDLIFKTKIDWV